MRVEVERGPVVRGVAVVGVVGQEGGGRDAAGVVAPQLLVVILVRPATGEPCHLGVRGLGLEEQTFEAAAWGAWQTHC